MKIYEVTRYIKVGISRGLVSSAVRVYLFLRLQKTLTSVFDKTCSIKKVIVRVTVFVTFKISLIITYHYIVVVCSLILDLFNSLKLLKIFNTMCLCCVCVCLSYNKSETFPV